LLLFLSFGLAMGCTLGPDYQRPVTPLPEEFRGPLPGLVCDAQGRTFGDLRWFELLQDPDLQSLIRTALKENHDVRIAAQRILEYQARLTGTRSSLFPSLQAGGKYMDTRTSEEGLSSPPPGMAERSAYQVSADLTWEIDFFGRVQRAAEASVAEFFAAEENRKLILQTLVTGLARAYIELLAFDLELDIARRTVLSRLESCRLVRIRQEGGVDSLLALRQAEGLVHGASMTIPELERQVEQKENEIMALLGGYPGPVRRGKLLEQHLKVEIPPGLPSSLLERRPDIRSAEEQLIAANAKIGEAKAQLFPRIALTATGGYESRSFSELIDPASRFWTLVPSLTQPFFTAGRLMANVEAAEARKEQALLTYQKTVQQAFREVADTLVGYRKLREKRQAQERLVNTLTDQARLARRRYHGGVSSYLEVLDSERQLFDAELILAQDRGKEILSVIALYRALGGGWTVEEPGL
jgi:multidrug efflux system outer membrane protein